ncbi:MAG: VOC family protein [Ruaniaceae bacterium]|nr:VOC family protein [Ruaniaceae bacterium]
MSSTVGEHATPSTPTESVSERFLSAATGMAAPLLRVGDLEGMSSYYTNALAFTELEERTIGREVHRVLGRGATPLLRLVHTPDLPGVDRTQAGLYHNAFLFDDAAGLAKTVYRAAQDSRSRFAGSADHFVSEAFYFTDPEGNGIELYTDRPRAQWQRARGQIIMGTEYLDPTHYLESHLTQSVLDDDAVRPGTVGHVHLQVGDLRTARAFYVDALGFEVTMDEYPGSLFASAGGYHHHVAMNTWHSSGAGPRAASLGLAELAVAVPTREDLDALIARYRVHGIPFADAGNAVTAADPWGTPVTVSLAGNDCLNDLPLGELLE